MESIILAMREIREILELDVVVTGWSGRWIFRVVWKLDSIGVNPIKIGDLAINTPQNVAK